LRAALNRRNRVYCQINIDDPIYYGNPVSNQFYAKTARNVKDSKRD